MDVDDVLKSIGQCGRYQQTLLWFVLLPSVVPCAFHAYTQVFLSAKPEHWCHVPELKELGYPPEVRRNISSSEDGCFMWDKNYTNRELLTSGGNGAPMVHCKYGWEFDHSKYPSTVVTEWNLVCEDGLSTTLALVLYAIGGLVGNYIFGYIQDSIGRRPAFFIYLGIECIFTVASAFATSFISWVILRTGVGFTVPAILGTPMVLSLELVGPQKRTMAFVLINIAFSLGLVLLSGVVYWFRAWRDLTLVSGLPFLLYFFYWWVLPESPRWLVARGRYIEAEKILKKMADVNGRQLPDDCIERLKIKARMDSTEKAEEERKRRYGVFDLFRYPNLRKKTIIVTFIWFTNTAVYVGLSYYAPALGGDEFLNFFLAGVVELPTYLVLWPALERVGRRWVLCTSMIVGGSACLATILVQKDRVVTLVLYCIGKMGISSSFVAVPLVASELYPTVVRGLGISTSSVVAQIGPILIPLVNHLGERWRVLPLLVMGALLVAGGVSSLLLPETLNKHLPQTLEDGEKCPLKISSPVTAVVKMKKGDQDDEQAPNNSHDNSSQVT